MKMRTHSPMDSWGNERCLPIEPGKILVVQGPAGSGKTSLLLNRLSQEAIQAEKAVLMLSSSRIAASRVAQELATRLPDGLGASRSLTWPAYAFDLIVRAQAEGIIPWIARKPRLRTGAEQDHRFSELLERIPAQEISDRLKQAAYTRGMRQQLRDFADVATQLGAQPQEIMELSRQHDRPEWALAAQIISSYRDLNAASETEALDALELSLSASNILRHNPEFAERERSRFALIGVDDAQNLTRPELGLLAELAQGDTGAGVMATFDEHSTVQAFRGADPRRVADLLDERASARMELKGSLRQGREIFRVLEGLKERLPVGKKPGVNAPGQGACIEHPPASWEGQVRAHVVGDSLQELRFIATQILELMVRPEDSVSPSQIAVIVRSSATARSLERQLMSLGVPVQIPPAVLTLKEAPAARPLLEIMRIALETMDVPSQGREERADKIDAARIADILCSPLIGMSSAQMRTLRQELRRREYAAVYGSSASEGGPARPRLSDELLVEAVLDPFEDSTCPGMRRLARSVRAARGAIKQYAADPQQVLWAIWNACARAETWKKKALAGDADSSRYHRYLDSVVSLFYAAERFVDQRPGGTSTDFLAELDEQEVPVDTVAKQSHLGECVNILTPSAALGREFDTVFVAGLQDGVWPNPSLRGEILATSDLIDAFESRRQGRPFAPSPRAERLAEVKVDELRLFLVAASRARQRLVLTAVRGMEESPSIFFDLVAASIGEDSTLMPLSVPPRPRTMRALVGELRQNAESAEEKVAKDAAFLLSKISQNGLSRAAHPSSWWGLEGLSTEEAILPEDAKISVSPSRIQQAIEDPLGWFVQSIGGEVSVDFSRQLGTLIHAIAEEHPEGTKEELAAALERAWEFFPDRESFSVQSERVLADGLISSLCRYILQARAEGRTVPSDGVEVPLSLEFPVTVQGKERTAVLKGSVDRLERDEQGRLTLVDLKTSKYPLSQADAEKHPQLAAYQFAASKGALEIEGPQEVSQARLVYLGAPNVRSIAVREQDRVQALKIAEELLQGAAEVMSGSEFDAVNSAAAQRRRTVLPEIDPNLPQGRPVTRMEKIPEGSQHPMIHEDFSERHEPGAKTEGEDR